MCCKGVEIGRGENPLSYKRCRFWCGWHPRENLEISRIPEIIVLFPFKVIRNPEIEKNTHTHTHR